MRTQDQARQVCLQHSGDPEKDLSSAAGDTSDCSTAAPRLGSSNELDEEAQREVRESVTQALARKGSS